MFGDHFIRVLYGHQEGDECPRQRREVGQEESIVDHAMRDAAHERSKRAHRPDIPSDCLYMPPGPPRQSDRKRRHRGQPHHTQPEPGVQHEVVRMRCVALWPPHWLDIATGVLVQELIRAHAEQRVIEDHVPACAPDREPGGLRAGTARVGESVREEDDACTRKTDPAHRDQQQPCPEPTQDEQNRHAGGQGDQGASRERQGQAGELDRGEQPDRPPAGSNHAKADRYQQGPLEVEREVVWMRVSRRGTGHRPCLNTTQVKGDLRNRISADDRARQHNSPAEHVARDTVPEDEACHDEEQERLEDDRPRLAQRFRAVSRIRECQHGDCRSNHEHRRWDNDLRGAEDVANPLPAIAQRLDQHAQTNSGGRRQDREFEKAERSTRHRVQVVHRRGGDHNGGNTGDR